MDSGFPVGVFNIHGTPAISLITEKMPDVAYTALSQYMEVDLSKKMIKYFLKTLENIDSKANSREKSPLEVKYFDGYKV